MRKTHLDHFVDHSLHALGLSNIDFDSTRGAAGFLNLPDDGADGALRGVRVRRKSNIRVVGI